MNRIVTLEFENSPENIIKVQKSLEDFAEYVVNEIEREHYEDQIKHFKTRRGEGQDLVEKISGKLLFKFADFFNLPKLMDEGISQIMEAESEKNKLKAFKALGVTTAKLTPTFVLAFNINEVNQWIRDLAVKGMINGPEFAYSSFEWAAQNAHNITAATAFSALLYALCKVVNKVMERKTYRTELDMKTRIHEINSRQRELETELKKVAKSSAPNKTSLYFNNISQELVFSIFKGRKLSSDDLPAKVHLNLKSDIQYFWYESGNVNNILGKNNLKDSVSINQLIMELYLQNGKFKEDRKSTSLNSYSNSIISGLLELKKLGQDKIKLDMELAHVDTAPMYQLLLMNLHKQVKNEVTEKRNNSQANDADYIRNANFA